MYDTDNTQTNLTGQKQNQEFNADVYVRLGFIRKVYGILAIMLTISSFFISLSTIKPIHDYFLPHYKFEHLKFQKFHNLLNLF